MCRVFALSAGRNRVYATFWLLEAPDGLALQSRAEPDGAGIGRYTSEGKSELYRTPERAYEDADFATGCLTR
jgi:glutamine amidotransferase